MRQQNEAAAAPGNLMHCRQNALESCRICHAAVLNGQVEIDALFFAPRNGKECLFLVEAKTGNGRRSLAKHKLVYPVLALRREIPRAIPIVPVYLHVERSDSEYRFHVAECELVVPAETLPVLCDLRVVSNRTLVLPSFSQSL